MICWRMGNIVERFPRDSDDVRLSNLKPVCSFDVERKLPSRPIEYSLPDLMVNLASIRSQFPLKRLA